VFSQAANTPGTGGVGYTQAGNPELTTALIAQLQA
jgi:hypothetical protein